MIRRLATKVLAAPPLWAALHRRATTARPVTVLCYHTLGPDRGGVDGWTMLRQRDFRAQLDMLNRHYEIVSLDAALDPDPGTGKPRAVLTFDDGDRGLSAHLLPILSDHPVPVTVYVATGQFETGRPFWFDRAVNALQGDGVIDVEGLGRWTLPPKGQGGKARWAVVGDILAALKAAPPKDRERLTDTVADQGTDPPDPALGPMTMDELKTLAARPGVTIGAHSHGHELLDQIPLEDARDSVARSRDLLRDWTGQEIRHFAWPNGNHTAALRAMVRNLGFASATALGETVAPKDADRFALPRISVGRYDSLERVKLRLVGL